MKKLISLFLVLVLLAGCGNNANEEPEETSSTSQAKVGILQLMTHDALDLSREGFIDALKERGMEPGIGLRRARQPHQRKHRSL